MALVVAVVVVITTTRRSVNWQRAYNLGHLPLIFPLKNYWQKGGPVAGASPLASIVPVTFVGFVSQGRHNQSP